MIIVRLITKVFVRFASVALMVQVSLVSLPSAQTISAQTEREALGSALSETVEQIEGTYEGTFTLSQVTGEHQISLTFQQSGPEVIVTYRSVLGGRGIGKSTIAGNVITAVPLRSEPNCPGLFTASFKFFGDTVSFTYSGQDCNGPAQGRGIAKKLKLVSPLTSEADELTSKAIALVQAGKYAEAISLAQQVLAIREKVLGPDHPDVATVLYNFGMLYEEAGRFAEAEPLYKRSLAIREKALGPDHPDHFLVAQSLNNLAELYERLGRYTEAEPLNQRALAIFEKTLGPDNFEVADSLNNLAALYDQQGRYAEAEPLFKRSLAIREKALGPDHRNVNIAQSLNNLASLYVHQGRYTEAELLYKRSLVIYEQVLGPDHSLVANTLNNLAVLYETQLRFTDALPLVRRMISSGFRAQKSVALPVLMISQVKSQIPSDQAFDDSLKVIQGALQTSAAAALNNLNVRFSAGNDRLAQLVRKDQDLTAEAERLDKAIVEAVSKEPSKRDNIAEQRIRDRRGEVSKERGELQQVFVRDFRNYAALSKPEPLTTKEIQSLLDKDEALVVIDLDEYSFVWVVTKDRADWKAILIPAAQASKTIETLRAALNPYPDSPKTFDRALAYQLYRQVLGPVEETISQKTRLSFVLGGALTSLPPQVLITRDPNGKDLASLDWLIRKYAVTVLPSIASLKILRGEKSTVAATKPMIGFGDPVFDRTTPTPGRQHVSALNRSLTSFYRGMTADTKSLAEALPALPETVDELRAVAKELGAKAEDLKLGEAASVTNVKKERLDNYRVVYFATHALVAGEVEKFAKVKAEPALVLSIPEKPTDEDDGLLRASDVAMLKMNADFVVLSACNTAAGDKPGAEALSGLARAFFYAGARSLVVSHWEVDSEATVALMDGLFDALKANPHLSHADALRASMLRMIAKPSKAEWAHPQFWAPFVVVGEPQRH
jgi:CHAT domain-containing protein/tetratricopeptide (TPR) repeat protein